MAVEALPRPKEIAHLVRQIDLHLEAVEIDGSALFAVGYQFLR